MLVVAETRNPFSEQSSAGVVLKDVAMGRPPRRIVHKIPNPGAVGSNPAGDITFSMD